MNEINRYKLINKIQIKSIEVKILSCYTFIGNKIKVVTDMELKSIGKFAKGIGVTTISIGIKEKKKEDQNSSQNEPSGNFKSLYLIKNIDG